MKSACVCVCVLVPLTYRFTFTPGMFMARFVCLGSIASNITLPFDLSLSSFAS